MKILSYNLNGIRSAISKDFENFLAQNEFDIVCVQETKAQPDQVDMAKIKELGYHHHWFSAQKKGYSGVLTMSRVKPDQVVVGCGIEKYDFEGRILRTDFGDWTLLNCYFPSGTSGDERQDVKISFLNDFFDFVTALKQERPKLIVVGDYNIAHQEIDIHDPKGNKNSTGFLPEERAWLTKWFESGFTDAFRHVHPVLVEYSWWSFRTGARAKNKGWRIDYQSVSDNLKDKIKSAHHLTNDTHSDHCGILLEIDL